MKNIILLIIVLLIIFGVKTIYYSPNGDFLQKQEIINKLTQQLDSANVYNTHVQAAAIEAF